MAITVNLVPQCPPRMSRVPLHIPLSSELSDLWTSRKPVLLHLLSLAGIWNLSKAGEWFHSSRDFHSVLEGRDRYSIMCFVKTTRHLHLWRLMRCFRHQGYLNMSLHRLVGIYNYKQSKFYLNYSRFYLILVLKCIWTVHGLSFFFF